MCTTPKPKYSAPAPQPPVAAAAVAPTPPEPEPVRAAASAPTEASRSAQKAQSVLGQQRPPSSVATSGRGVLAAAETRQKRLLGQ